jgi:hypothetical protein
MSMRRRSREVNVFGASALDLFASALAAFIVITLMILPFFLKYDDVLMEQVRELQARMAETEQELEATRAELSVTQADLAQSAQDLETASEQLSAAEAARAQAEQELEDTREQLAAAEAELARTRQALEQCQQERDSMGSELAQCVEELNTTFLTTMIRWDTADDVDLHIIDPDGNEFYYEQPNFPGVPGALTRDIVTGPGIEVFEEPNTRTGTFRVVYLLYSGDPVQVDGVIYTRQGRQELPSIYLQTAGERVPVADVTVNADGSVVISNN